MYSQQSISQSSQARPAHLFILVFMVILGASSLVACADTAGMDSENGSEKGAYSDQDEWGQDPNSPWENTNQESGYDDYQADPNSPDAAYEGAADQLLNTYIEVYEEEEALYAPDIQTAVLQCEHGLIKVAAGALTGAGIGAVVAQSGFVTGPGVAVIGPTAVTSFATIGGAIGLMGSLPDWFGCINGIAMIALQLVRSFPRAAFDVQVMVSQAIARGASTRRAAASSSAECQGGGRLCQNMNQRYHNYCDPLQDMNELLTGAWNGQMCKRDVFFSRFTCDDLRRVIDQAAGCSVGRYTVTQRCYGGDWGPTHFPPYKNAKDLLGACRSLYLGSCGDLPSQADQERQAQNQFPECR